MDARIRETTRLHSERLFVTCVLMIVFKGLTEQALTLKGCRMDEESLTSSLNAEHELPDQLEILGSQGTAC